MKNKELPTVWPANDGDIRITDMSESHLLYAIASMFKRKAKMVKFDGDVSKSKMLTALLNEAVSRNILPEIRAVDGEKATKQNAFF